MLNFDKQIFNISCTLIFVSQSSHKILINTPNLTIDPIKPTTNQTDPIPTPKTTPNKSTPTQTKDPKIPNTNQTDPIPTPKPTPKEPTPTKTKDPKIPNATIIDPMPTDPIGPKPTPTINPKKQISFSGLYSTNIAKIPGFRIKFLSNSNMRLTGGCNDYILEYKAYDNGTCIISNSKLLTDRKCSVNYDS
jgi:hypothetical protein